MQMWRRGTLTAGMATVSVLLGCGCDGGTPLRRAHGWQAVSDAARARMQPVLGGLHPEMEGEMLRGRHAQMDFIYEPERYEENRAYLAGGKRRLPEASWLDDFKPRRGRELFENEIWDATSAGQQKQKLYDRSMRDEDRIFDIEPGTKAYAMCVRLWSACRFGLEEEIMPALQAGANIHMRDEDPERWDGEEGLIPYDKECLHGCTALHWAAYADEPACIDTLMQCGALVGRLSDGGLTALDIAASMGNTRACVALIRNGADVTHLDDWGLSVGDHAALNGHWETSDLLDEAINAHQELALEDDILAYGRQLSDCKQREAAGFMVHPHEKQALDARGRALAIKLLHLRQLHGNAGDKTAADRIAGARQTGPLEGSTIPAPEAKGCRSSGLEETVEAEEERLLRVEAEQLLSRRVADSYNEAVELALRDRDSLRSLRKTAADARRFQEEVVGVSSSDSAGEEGDGKRRGEDVGAGAGDYDDGNMGDDDDGKTNRKPHEEGIELGATHKVLQMRASLEELKKTSVRWRVLDRLSVYPYDQDAVKELVGVCVCACFRVFTRARARDVSCVAAKHRAEADLYPSTDTPDDNRNHSDIVSVRPRRFLLYGLS